jgi:hypothetical protein
MSHVLHAGAQLWEEKKLWKREEETKDGRRHIGKAGENGQDKSNTEDKVERGQRCRKAESEVTATCNCKAGSRSIREGLYDEHHDQRVKEACRAERERKKTAKTDEQKTREGREVWEAQKEEY